ncbi:MAG: transporter [Desulfobaccales bacterium]
MKTFPTQNKSWLFLVLALIFTWTLAVPPTLAQGPGVPFVLPGPPEKEEEPPATFGPLITDTAIPIDKGEFAVQPTFGLGFVTDVFNDRGRRTSARGNFYSFGMDWKLTYGIFKNTEIFVVIPYVHNWVDSADERGPSGERSANYGNIGDVNLTVKFRLVEETKKWPTITALFATDFPTGRFRGLRPHLLGTDETGGGAYVLTAGLNISKWVKPFIFYGNLWYSWQTSFVNDDGRQFPRDFVTVNLAAEYPINSKWVALLELTSYWDGGRMIGHKPNTPPSNLLSILPGIEYMASEKISFALGVNFDLAGRNNAANITPLFSLVYNF